MIQKGELSRVSFPRLVQWFITNSKRGTLRIKNETDSSILLIDNGLLVGAFSDNQRYKLWMFLYKRGLLNEAQLAQLQKQQKETNKRLEDLLIELGFFTSEELTRQKAEQAIEIAISLFDWSSGDFYFYQDQYPDNQETSVSISLQEIMVKGNQRQQLWHIIQQRFHLEDKLKLAFQGKFDDLFRRPLTLYETKLIQALQQELPLSQLLKQSSLSEFETYQFLYMLFQKNHLTIISSSEQHASDLVKKAEALKSEKKFWDAFMVIKELVSLDEKNDTYQQLLTDYTQDLFSDLKSKLGNLNVVPRIVKDLDPYLWKNLGLDAGDGFILSRIDGRSKLRDLLKLIQMDSKRVMTTFYRLLGAGIIEITQPSFTDEELQLRIQELITINREMTNQNYYQRLGVESGAEEFAIKRSYLELVRRYHPDTVPVEPSGQLFRWSEAIFTKVYEAYQTLSAPETRREYDLAIGLIKQSTKDDEAHRQKVRAQTQFRIALQAFKTRDYPRAIEFFQSAIDLSPNEAMYYAKLSEVCMKNPRWYKSGINACRHAIELDIENPNYYCLLGMLLKLDGDLIEAETQFKNALNIDPTNLLARREMLSLGHKLKDLPNRKVISEMMGTEIAPKSKKK